MAYSFFPNDFNKTPNLQDQVFLMRQKQAEEQLLKIAADKAKNTNAEQSADDVSK
jgi:hypothetical protein